MVPVHRIGFTNVSALRGCQDDQEAKCNVIFIHGLKGHPRGTWGPPKSSKTQNAPPSPPSKWKTIQSMFHRDKASNSLTSDAVSERSQANSFSESATTEKLFWPAEFLCKDCPNARIWTYGYNADVLAGMFQMNNKNSISQHSRDLAARLEREIDNNDPIVFVAHSLGGILVKDAMHRSDVCRKRTGHIIFLGTPHRGSAYAGWGDIVSNLARLAGQDPNSKSLKTLQVNSEVLDNIHDEFKSIVHAQNTKIHTFQEARGIAIMKGSDHKVVNNVSSIVDLPRSLETVESMDADHMQMVKCGSRSDMSYRAILGVIKNFISDLLDAKFNLLDTSEREGMSTKSTDGSTTASISAPTTRLSTQSSSSTQYNEMRTETECQSFLNTGQPDVEHLLTTSHLPERLGAEANGPAPVFLVPWNKNPDFIDRPKILMRIREHFGHGVAASPHDRRQRVAIHGLGGVGKTQIALSYAYWLREFCPTISIFWIHASSTDRFCHAYSNIAKACGIPDHDDPESDLLELVKGWLERQASSPWMLIIDNADDAELFFQSSSSDKTSNSSTNSAVQPTALLGQYIPDCSHGSVLITTRNKAVGVKLAPGKPPIEVDKMDESESDQLLRAILSDSEISQEDSTTLTSTLENLPLCIAQAAAFILENSISVPDYIELLHGGDQELVNSLSEPFEALGRDSGMPHAVAATWIISFEQIRRQSVLASDILSFVSLFNRQAIPKDFLLEYYRETRGTVGASEKLEITKALGILKSFSFVSEAKDQHLSIHRLVQLVTRKWLMKENRIQPFATEALHILSIKYPDADDESLQTCASYLPHAQSVLRYGDPESVDDQLSRARILYFLCQFYMFTSQYEVCETMQAESLRIEEKLLGSDHSDTITGINAMAEILSRLKKHNEAEKLCVQALESRIKIHGSNHPRTLNCMSYLADAYKAQKRYDEAIALYLETIEKSKRLLGHEHGDTLMYMTDLALIYCKPDVDREEEGAVIHKFVAESREEKLGATHPLTLDSKSNLSYAYWSLGKDEMALPLAIEVYEGSKTLLGPDHQATLERMGRLGKVYRFLDQLEESLALEMQRYRLLREKLGAHHYKAEDSFLSLADLYFHLGKSEKAEGMYTEVFERRKKMRGLDDKKTLDTMHSLANVLAQLGKFTEAFALGEDCLNRYTSNLGADDPFTTIVSDTIERWKIYQAYGMVYVNGRMECRDELEDDSAAEEDEEHQEGLMQPPK